MLMLSFLTNPLRTNTFDCCIFFGGVCWFSATCTKSLLLPCSTICLPLLQSVNQYLFSAKSPHLTALLFYQRHIHFGRFRRKTKVNINKPPRQGHKFSFFFLEPWSMTTVRQLFTLIGENCYARWTFVSELKQRSEQPHEGTFYRENLWRRPLCTLVLEQRKLEKKKEGCPLKNQEMRLQDANCSPCSVFLTSYSSSTPSVNTGPT